MIFHRILTDEIDAVTLSSFSIQLSVDFPSPITVMEKLSAGNDLQSFPGYNPDIAYYDVGAGSQRP